MIKDEKADQLKNTKAAESKKNNNVKDEVKGGDDGKAKKADESKQADSGVFTSIYSATRIDMIYEIHVGTTDVPTAHPTDKGAEEQASSVKPEGDSPNKIEQEAHSTASNGMSASVSLRFRVLTENCQRNYRRFVQQ